MGSTRGMVQVAGTTYRIVRLSPGQYSAVRVRDEAEVGTFSTYPKLRITRSRIEGVMMYEIARSALMGAKTSWGDAAGLRIRASEA
jgi:hypothetical protein